MHRERRSTIGKICEFGNDELVDVGHRGRIEQVNITPAVERRLNAG